MIIFYFLILGGIKIILEESDSFCSYSLSKKKKVKNASRSCSPVQNIYKRHFSSRVYIHFSSKNQRPQHFSLLLRSSNSPLLTYLLRIHTHTHARETTKRTFHVLPRFTFRSLIDRGHAITNQEPGTGSSPVEINLSFPLDYPADSTTNEPKEK